MTLAFVAFVLLITDPMTTAGKGTSHSEYLPFGDRKCSFTLLILSRFGFHVAKCVSKTLFYAILPVIIYAFVPLYSAAERCHRQSPCFKNYSTVKAIWESVRFSFRRLIFITYIFANWSSAVTERVLRFPATTVFDFESSWKTQNAPCEERESDNHRIYGFSPSPLASRIRL